MAITLKEMGQGYVQTIQFRIERAEKEGQEIAQHITELTQHLKDCKDALELEVSGDKKSSDDYIVFYSRLITQLKGFLNGVKMR